MGLTSPGLSIYPRFLPSEPLVDQEAGNDFFSIFKGEYGYNLIPFASARAAMVFAARALGLTRNTEILVPPWLGHCVLSAISRVITPSLHFSPLTRAILVYHQFGYPQNIEAIEELAQKYNLRILNDCANTLFTKHSAGSILEWGDATLVSLAKLYPSGLGGGLYSQQPEVMRQLREKYGTASTLTQEFAETALATLVRSDIPGRSFSDSMNIEAVFGYLPDLVAIPRLSLASLPNSSNEIMTDIDHRARIRDIVHDFFPESVPECHKETVIPFAIPIRLVENGAEARLQEFCGNHGIFLPIMHFDYAMNMLAPNYRKSIVIGCHAGWSQPLVESVCIALKEGKIC